MRQDSLYFRSENKFPLRKRIKKRLNPHSVAGNEKSAPFFFPDSKRENAVKPVYASLTPYCIRFKEHFRIGMPFEFTAAVYKLALKLSCVVKLAVVDKCIILTVMLCCHRLASVFYIDDAES